jgi:molybdate transport system substrate-binding protein
MRSKSGIIVLITTCLVSSAWAADVTVLSAGAVTPGLTSAAASFEKEKARVIKMSFDTAPGIRKRVENGEPFDIVIAPPAAITNFAKLGKLREERVAVGRVGIGVAVRPGAPIPDISDAEAFKRSVLEADSLLFNRASTGLYLEDLFKKLGIYEKLEPKVRRHEGSVSDHVLNGKGKEIGFSPITDILAHRDKGLRLVGPLPPEMQNYTAYVAALATNASEASRDFLRYLGSPQGKAIFSTAGIE